MDISTIN